MTFWSGETLKKRLGSEGIIDEFDVKQIDCAAYTLRVGAEVYITPDATNNSRKIINLEEGEHFIIPSGQFAWILTKETIKIPNNAIAFISLKTKIKFKGLINVSGFHVDPGFHGKLVYAVYNAGPQEIRLAQGKDLFLIWFSNLDNLETRIFRDNENNGIQDRIHEDFLVPGEILSLQNLKDEIKRVDDKLNRFETKFSQIKWLIGGAVAILVIVTRNPLIDFGKQVLRFFGII